MNSLGSTVLRPGTAEDAASAHELMMSELGRGPSVTRVGEQLASYPSVIAFDGDQMIGFTLSASLAPDIIELGNLLVQLEYRHNGIATAMIGKFEEISLERYSAVVVCTSELWPVKRGEKRSVVPLYERIGYRVLHRTQHSVMLIKELES